MPLCTRRLPGMPLQLLLWVLALKQSVCQCPSAHAGCWACHFSPCSEFQPLSSLSADAPMHVQADGQAPAFLPPLSIGPPPLAG
eukprot:scaffold60277_cov21-Tisochrysis_lutea.AAC.1